MTSKRNFIANPCCRRTDPDYESSTNNTPGTALETGLSGPRTQGFFLCIASGLCGEGDAPILAVKAAVLHGIQDVRIEQIERRPLGAGEVRVRIEAALTCGTDLKVFKRGYHACMILPPAVFGHELAGFISEVQRSSWAV